MVEQDSEQLDDVFRALADSTRRMMLRRLANGELSVGELARPAEMSLAAASKHIRVLESAGLVDRTIVGRRHVVSLAPAALARAHAWLREYERFWTHRLDVLEQLLKTDGEHDDDNER